MSESASMPGRGQKSHAGPSIVPAWNLLLPDGNQLGEDRIRLLRAIAQSGSLLEAASICKLSYRTAWTRVRQLNTIFPNPLVESVQGGIEGGKTRLSPQAVKLVALHAKASSLFRRAAAQEGLDPDNLNALHDFRKRLTVRTSVRNQLTGTIRSIKRGRVNADIVMDLRGGSTLSSQISLSSCDALGLHLGQEAWALVKSTWVELAVGPNPPRVSARNVLRGIVAHIEKGSVNDEICLELPGQDRITAMISPDARRELKLRKGNSVWAIFKASSVILAVN